MNHHELGRRSKQKGKRGEREVANILKRYGYEARRTAQYCGSTGDASDVIGLEGYHIEVKNVERLNLWKAIEQSTHDAMEAGKNETPVVVFKRSREPWQICMEFEEFLKILQNHQNNAQNDRTKLGSD